MKKVIAIHYVGDNEPYYVDSYYFEPRKVDPANNDVHGDNRDSCHVTTIRDKHFALQWSAKHAVEVQDRIRKSIAAFTTNKSVKMRDVFANATAVLIEDAQLRALTLRG